MFVRLDDTEYVVRGCKNIGRSGNMATRQIINIRLKTASKKIGKSRITVTSSYFSGILLKLKDIEDKTGKITNDDILKVKEEYGMRTVQSKNKSKICGDIKQKYKLFKRDLIL